MKRYKEFIGESSAQSLIDEWKRAIYGEPEGRSFNERLIISLIDKGVDVNITDDDGFHALHTFAAEIRSEVVYKLLKQENIDVNFINPNSQTALLVAAWSHRIRNNTLIMYELLCHPKIDVNILNDENQNFIDEMGNSDKAFLTGYNLQKNIINNNPSNIKLFIKYDLINPRIKEEYPYLFTGADLNLL